MSCANPYSPPSAGGCSGDDSGSFRQPDGTDADKSPFAWWGANRLRYNVGLALAGPVAFMCYVMVCWTLLPRVLDASEIDVTVLTTLFQGAAYQVMMGVANVFYFIGPVSEYVVRPANAERYRQTCYRLGFWFSALLPFSIPAILTAEILFFPACWEH